MNRTSLTFCVLMAGAGFSLPFVTANNDVPSGLADGQNTENKAAAIDQPDTVFPAMPQLRLAEFHSRDAVGPVDLETVAARAREWVRQGESAADPVIQARFLLAAANATLSYEPAQALTHAFLGLSSQDVGVSARRDDESARRAIMEASQWIDQARSLLETVQATEVEEVEPEDHGEPAAGNGIVEPNAKPEQLGQSELRRLTLAAATLSAFSQTFVAYLAPPEEPDAYRQAREAATALAPVLEDSDPAVASAAKFWQSALRSREDDPTPALLRLDRVNLVPDRQTQPYALFSRLLRCRLIAQHGSTPTGLALMLQLDERCHEWFTDEQRRDEALRTIALSRLHLLRTWYEKAEALGQTDESQWCARQARRIIEKHFDESTAILPLVPAMPIILDAPPAIVPEESALPPSD